MRLIKRDFEKQEYIINCLKNKPQITKNGVIRHTILHKEYIWISKWKYSISKRKCVSSSSHIKIFFRNIYKMNFRTTASFMKNMVFKYSNF